MDVQIAVLGMLVIIMFILAYGASFRRFYRLRGILPRKTEKLRMNEARKFSKRLSEANLGSDEWYLPQHSPKEIDWRGTDRRLALRPHESRVIRSLDPSDNGIDLARALIRDTTGIGLSALLAGTIATSAGFAVSLAFRVHNQPPIDAAALSFFVIIGTAAILFSGMIAFDAPLRIWLLNRDGVTVRSVGFLRASQTGPTSTREEMMLRRHADLLEQAMAQMNLAPLNLSAMLKGIQSDSTGLRAARMAVLNRLVAYYRGDFTSVQVSRPHIERVRSLAAKAIGFLTVVATVAAFLSAIVSMVTAFQG